MSRKLTEKSLILQNELHKLADPKLKSWWENYVKQG